jgi:Glycosyl transferase family 2
MTPLVSVVITSYNREDYLAASIQSVLGQTTRDFEVIVSDDASTDRSVAIAEEYARRDPRVRVFRNAKNAGDYPNRRHAATLARGEFLKYHDSDDVMYPHCLEVLVAALEGAPTAACALSAATAWTGGPSPMLLTPEQAYEREFLGAGLFHLGPSAALFRTEAFRQLGGFPSRGAGSDYLFWLNACARVNVLLAPGDLFFYRVHSGQELTKPSSDLEYARATADGWRMLHSPECPLSGERLALAKRNFVFLQARGIVRRVRRGQFRSAMNIARYAGIGPLDWIRYLRRPQRRIDAGIPVPGRQTP